MSNKFKVYVVTGRSASGKSSVASFLKAQYENCSVANVGDALADYLDFHPNEKTNRPEIGHRFLAEHGREAISKVLFEVLEGIKNAGTSRVIVDGIRFDTTLDQIKDKYPDLLHIHVVAKSDRIAMRKMLRRGISPNSEADRPDDAFDEHADKLASRANMIVSTSKDQTMLLEKGSNRPLKVGDSAFDFID